MSLNGLDDQAVAEAYQSALAEAGGWFLLKYASRDAVEILVAGTGASGGVSELRKAVAQYEDKSPLYGFLLYRRRRVLLKYIPEGTSRLLQARVTVHFTEIEEKFSPHDSVFNFTSAEELTDNALAAANSLHTAAPSNASSDKKKLDGIDEDAEEAQDTSIASEGAALEKTETASKTDVGSAVNAEGTSSPPSPRSTGDQRPKTPGGTGQHSLDGVLGSPKGYATSVHSLNQYDPLYQDDPNRRSSSQTARAGSADLYDFSYLYKPKVKLGPRPTMERPSSGDGHGKSAKLPSSLKAAVRKTAPSRPKSRDSSAVPSIGVPPPSNMPPIPDIPVTTPTRPTSSPGPQSSAASTKSNGITPEKQRLKKALELRKKQMAAKAAKAQSDKLEVPAVEAMSGIDEEGATTAEEEDSSTQETSGSNDSGKTLKAEDPATPDHTKADSGVLVSESGEGDEEDARAPTPVASSPISIQESLNPSSTRPSSISEGGDRKDLLSTEEKPEILVTNPGAEARTGSVAANLSSVCQAEQPVAAVSSPDRGATGVHQTTAAKGLGPIEDNKTASPTLEDAASVPLPQRRSLSTKRRSRNSVNIDVTGETSDVDYLSDDSFMEELQSATVEEAKPMSVSKSPIMPIFPRRRSANSEAAPPAEPQRVVSNPVATSSQASLSPENPPERIGRSLSASYAAMSHEKEAPPLKRPGVSSGIAGRIKALAEKSNREVTHMVPRSGGTSPDPSGSLIAQRQNSFRVSPSESRPASKHSMHSKRLSQGSIYSLQNPTPKFLAKQHTGSSNENLQTVYNKDANNKTGSVTVTARIIRTPGPEEPELSTPVDPKPLDLQQSDVTVGHASPQSPPSIQLSPSQNTPAPLSPAQESLERLPRSSSESSWRSFGRRRSEAMSPPPTLPRSQSITSLESTDSRAEEKKGSKASRLLKRMSNSFTASKKSLNQIVSPTVQEEPLVEEVPVAASISTATSKSVEIGDLNVQFPDTLLWKRRWVEIDAQGNLVLSAPLQTKGITKRYHLTEFLAPLIPDHERQEMPNSVILDFTDGRTLQCACEDSQGQVQVLQLLKNAHQSWVAQRR